MRTRDELAAATHARLLTIQNVAGYRNELPETPPTISTQDLRVRPYWVLHTNAGTSTDRRLGGDPGAMRWGFKLDAVVGAPDHFDPFVQALTDLMSGWRPFPDTARCWLDDTVDPGPGRVDQSQTPPRIWTPLYFLVAL